MMELMISLITGPPSGDQNVPFLQVTLEDQAVHGPPGGQGEDGFSQTTPGC